MLRLTRGLSGFAIILLVSAAVSVSAYGQEQKTDLKKKYAEILGEWEFEIQGTQILISFYVENNKLWGHQEGDPNPDDELIPVKDKEWEFEVENNAGHIEIKFSKDKNGKIAECNISFAAQGLEITGTRVKDGR